MKLYDLECFGCGERWQQELDDSKELAQQVSGCPKCGHKSYFIKPAEQKVKKGIIADLQLFLNQEEFNYLVRLLSRKMWGISQVIRRQETLKADGKHQIVANAKKAYPIVRGLLDKLNSLKG